MKPLAKPLAKHFALYGSLIKDPNGRAQELAAVSTGRYSLISTFRTDTTHVENLRKHVEHVAAQANIHLAPRLTRYTEVDWNLRHALGALAERHDWWLHGESGVATTWGQGWIDWTLPGVAEGVAETISAFRRRWKADPAHSPDVHIIEVCAERISPYWLPGTRARYGGPTRPLRKFAEVASVWQAATQRFFEIVEPFPTVTGGDGYSVELSRVQGIKMEDWLWRFGQELVPEEWAEEWVGVYTRRRGVMQSNEHCIGGGPFTFIDLQWHNYPSGAEEWERRQRLVIATAICAGLRCTISPNPDEADSPPGPFAHPWMDYALGAHRGAYRMHGFNGYQVEFEHGDVLVNVRSVPWTFGSVTVPPIDAMILRRHGKQPPR